MGPIRALGRAGPVAVIALMAAVLIMGPASAAPAPDNQSRAQQLAQQLQEQGQRVSMLDEQYNQARAQADSLQAQLASIGPRLAQSDRGLAAARDRLAGASVDAYVRGGSAPLLAAFIHANSNDFGVRSAYVSTALDGQRNAIAGFDTARRQLLRLRARLRQTQEAAQANAAALDANRQQAQAAIASVQSALSQAQGSLAPLVAQASAAQAAQAQAQGMQRFNTLTAAPASTTSTTAPKRGGTTPTTKASGSGAAQPTTTVAHTGSSPTTTVPKQPAPTGPPPPVSSGATAAVNMAKAQLGKPYEYGGAGPDTFDCSGLTMYAWQAGGVGLPHSAAMQYDAIPHVALTALQPGDLVFFGNPIYHVGIYVGNGQMINAPHTGAVVSYASIYWPDLVGAGRP